MHLYKFLFLVLYVKCILVFYKQILKLKLLLFVITL